MHSTHPVRAKGEVRRACQNVRLALTRVILAMGAGLCHVARCGRGRRPRSQNLSGADGDDSGDERQK